MLSSNIPALEQRGARLLSRLVPRRFPFPLCLCCFSRESASCALVMKGICCWLQCDCLADSWPAVYFAIYPRCPEPTQSRHRPLGENRERWMEARTACDAWFTSKIRFWGVVGFDTSGLHGLIGQAHTYSIHSQIHTVMNTSDRVYTRKHFFSS